MSESSETHDEFSDQNSEFDLPQHILEKYDSCQQVQLIRGYRILQVLKYYDDNRPFFEKPENEKRGNKYYYDVIESPMWLNEIKRKFFNAEYNSLLEVVKDMRLLCENCYYFWGPKSPMTEQCLHMERLMERQMSLLPRDLKSSCSLEESHGKNEDEVVTKVWNRCKHKGKNCSRLMLRAWRRRRIREAEEYDAKSDLSTYCENSKQIIKWERDRLLLGDNLRFISSAPELPQISLFFQLVQNSYDITSVCQTEVERMLLMPQYSHSFRRIFSTLLSDNHSDSALQYEDITKQFEKLISQWFSMYDECEDISEVLESVPVEASFFEVFECRNPFLTHKYEQLPYNQKVLILKSICDHLIRTRSEIAGSVANADEKELSSHELGRDKHYHKYFYFPIFLDFRLYRMKVKNHTHFTKDHSDAAAHEDEISRRNSLKRFFPTGCDGLEMIADSVEGIRRLVDELFYSDLENSKKDSKSTNAEIIEALRDLEADLRSEEDSCIRRRNEIRIKLFREWTESCTSHELPSDVESSGEERFYSDADDRASSGSDADETLADDKINEQRETEATLKAESKSKSSEAEESDENDDKSSSEKQDDDENVNAERRPSKEQDDDDDENVDKDDDNEDDDAADAGANDESALNSSFTEEMESVVKSEPTAFDEYTFDETNDIKEEVHSDNSQSGSSVSTRRRRSSVPSYSVFNEDFFSDESDVNSPEEVYTSDEDSDDDWQIPSKRTRNKKSPKMKPLKVKNEGSHYSDSRRRRKYVSKDENAPEPSAAESDAAADKLRIRVEKVKSDTVENFEKANDEPATPTKEDDRPASKIKVIDLAKLKSSEREPPAATAATAAAAQAITANAFIIQTRPTVSTLPIIGSCTSQNMNAYMNVQRGIAARPPNYPVNPAQHQFVMNPIHRTIQPQNVTIAPSPQSVIRTIGVSPYPIPAGAVAVHRGVPYRQIMRAPANMADNFVIDGMGQKRPLTYEKRMPNVVPIPKINKNVAAVPRIIGKPMQRRPLVREIEGAIGIHSNNGLLQYVVNLANGSHVPLSSEQVQKLRNGNGGTLPQKLKIPVPADVAEKIEPCVVIDD